VESVEAALDRAKDEGATKDMGWCAVALAPQKNLFG